MDFSKGERLEAACSIALLRDAPCNGELILTTPTLTPEKKEEMNARRRLARQKKTIDERNARQRQTRQNLSTKERQEMNARTKNQWSDMLITSTFLLYLVPLQNLFFQNSQFKFLFLSLLK